MAMSAHESRLIGILLLIGGFVGIGAMMILPEWDSISARNKTIEQAETNIAQLSQTEKTLRAQVDNYKSDKNLPKEYNLRTFTPQTLAPVVKEMVNTIVKLADKAGTGFISLEPYTITAPAAPTPKKGKKGAKAKEDTTPPKPELSYYGYELALRGNYQNVLLFLESLNDHRELIEVSEITLENEAGPQRQGGGAVKHEFLLDPNKPLKLTAKLKLILLPEKPTA